jgi:hypothetical protein
MKNTSKLIIIGCIAILANILIWAGILAFGVWVMVKVLEFTLVI